MHNSNELMIILQDRNIAAFAPADPIRPQIILRQLQIFAIVLKSRYHDENNSANYAIQ